MLKPTVLSQLGYNFALLTLFGEICDKACEADTYSVIKTLGSFVSGLNGSDLSS